MFEYILDRAKEPSSWRGLVWLATALGIHFTPEQGMAILALGAGAAGALGAFLPTKVKVPEGVITD